MYWTVNHFTFGEGLPNKGGLLGFIDHGRVLIRVAN